MSQSRPRSGRPTPTAPLAPNAEVAQFLDEFDAFLDTVRGLAGGTRRKYVRFVRHFLREWIADTPLQWQHLSADALRAYAGVLSGNPRKFRHPAWLKFSRRLA